MEQAESSVESEWMDVVANLQAQIVEEYRQEAARIGQSSAWLSVHELRLAALRHPEIAFWVKHNRAREGDLVVGKKAPDVPLVDPQSQKETTLLHQMSQKPTVVVAGSLS